MANVSLYYPGFDEFTELCETACIDNGDCQFSINVCSQMPKIFKTEDDQRHAVTELLKDYFGFEEGKDKFKGKGRKSCCDIMFGTHSCLSVEIKNEVGSEGAESYSQITGYYVQSLDGKNPELCPSPAFFLELIGPHLFVSGAVFAKIVLIDRLTPPLWLVIQPMRSKEMERFARTFKALKSSLIQLSLYYTV